MAGPLWLNWSWRSIRIIFPFLLFEFPRFRKKEKKLPFTCNPLHLTFCLSLRTPARSPIRSTKGSGSHSVTHQVPSNSGHQAIGLILPSFLLLISDITRHLDEFRVAHLSVICFQIQVSCHSPVLSNPSLDPSLATHCN